MHNEISLVSLPHLRTKANNKTYLDNALHQVIQDYQYPKSAEGIKYDSIIDWYKITDLYLWVLVSMPALHVTSKAVWRLELTSEDQQRITNMHAKYNP